MTARVEHSHRENWWAQAFWGSEDRSFRALGGPLSGGQLEPGFDKTWGPALRVSVV
jgi:hypothetical protein